MRPIDADALKNEMLSCAPIIIGDFYKILEKIDEQPTIEPDRPRGEWIDLSDGWQEGTFRCSSCQMEFVLIEGTPEDNEYNFCPNCGASMRKEGEGE